MDALAGSLRSRLASAFEWVVAALFLAGTLAVGGLLFRDLRLQPLAGSTISAGPPVTARVPRVDSRRRVVGAAAAARRRQRVAHW